MTAIEYYKEKFTDMTDKLYSVKNKDDISDVVRFIGIFSKAAQQRKKEIIKSDSRSKMYQSKAERNADKKEADKKEADKNNNSDSAASDTSSEVLAPPFSYT